jgi:hypothetical protein
LILIFAYLFSMSTYTCSKGHISDESDYCSECGVKITGNGAAISTSSVTSLQTGLQTCPDCATPHEVGSGNFCEICGYNFLTGGHGEVPIAIPNTATVVTPIQPVEPVANPVIEPLESISVVSETQENLTWELIVSIDPALASPESPPPPSDRPPITIRLEKPSNLIGRTSQLRAIYPEIPLDYDDAVSSRHALVNRQPDGSFVLRDIGSSNGTILNGIEIKSLVDIPLKNGDRFTLGHWTSITVKAIPS